MSRTTETMAITKTAKQKMRSVPLTGILRQTKKGFVYLKIPNDVMNGLFDCIDEPNIEKPPYNNSKFGRVGAHISVMYADEIKGKNIEISEIGKEFEFKLGKFYSTVPQGWDNVSRVWFITVEAPELEKLRQKYKLTKKLNGHEFHISVAIRKKNKKK